MAREFCHKPSGTTAVVRNHSGKLVQDQSLPNTKHTPARRHGRTTPRSRSKTSPVDGHDRRTTTTYNAAGVSHLQPTDTASFRTHRQSDKPQHQRQSRWPAGKNHEWYTPRRIVLHQEPYHDRKLRLLGDLPKDPPFLLPALRYTPTTISLSPSD